MILDKDSFLAKETLISILTYLTSVTGFILLYIGLSRGDSLTSPADFNFFSLHNLILLAGLTAFLYPIMYKRLWNEKEKAEDRLQTEIQQLYAILHSSQEEINVLKKQSEYLTKALIASRTDDKEPWD